MADLKLDFLAFGAHPDDVEITIGGTLLKLKKMGYKTGIVDFTRGESGTYGTVEQRKKESEKAAKILKVDVRENLELPDGAVRNTEESRLKVIEVIRKFKPEVVCAPVTKTRHPDHAQAGQTVKEAAFLSGLEKLKTGQDKHRPSTVLFFPELATYKPAFAVDVTEEWEEKIASIKAHASQVYDENIQSDMVKTFIKSKDFWEIIEAKFRYFGGIIGTKYAEVFEMDGVPRVDDVISAFTRMIK